jgi:hypothetical protein
MATLIDAHSTARVAVNQLSIDQKWGKRGEIRQTDRYKDRQMRDRQTDK